MKARIKQFVLASLSFCCIVNVYAATIEAYYAYSPNGNNCKINPACTLMNMQGNNSKIYQCKAGVVATSGCAVIPALYDNTKQSASIITSEVGAQLNQWGDEHIPPPGFYVIKEPLP